MSSIADKIKNLRTFRNMKPLEIGLLILFILYIIFPFPTPNVIASFVESPLGMVVLFCITLSLFVYTNPILGVVYILVAYELLRRSSLTTGRVSIVDSNNYPFPAESQTPPEQPSRVTRTIPTSQNQKDMELHTMNSVTVAGNTTLEEEVIMVTVPSNKNQAAVVQVEHNFFPVADNLIPGSSMY
jgi:hypothetical protein